MPTNTGVNVTQEWDNVVLKKSTTSNVEKSNNNKKVSQFDAKQKKIENATDVDVIDMMPRNITIQLISGRVAKKLSQKQLANNLNINLKIIQDIETHKYKKDMNLAQKIARYLGIKLVK